MVKALATATLVMVLIDFAIDHGAYTHSVIGGVGSFLQWIVQAGQDSIFSR